MKEFIHLFKDGSARTIRQKLGLRMDLVAGFEVVAEESPLYTEGVGCIVITLLGALPTFWAAEKYDVLVEQYQRQRALS